MARTFHLLLAVAILYGIDYVNGQMKSCDCACYNLDNALENDPVLKEKVEKMSSELKIDTKNTSSHQRSLTSAKDDRPSAQAAGYVGIGILCFVFGLLIFFDGIGVIASKAFGEPETD